LVDRGRLSGSPSTVELRERLARLEAALVERDARIEVLTARVAQLEALLRRDSRTSSKPPSSDGPVKPSPRSRRESSGRLPGKQPGDPGFTLRQVAVADEVIVHRPGDCRGCGRSLRRAPACSVETRQVFDDACQRPVGHDRTSGFAADRATLPMRSSLLQTCANP
jgi:transposase